MKLLKFAAIILLLEVKLISCKFSHFTKIGSLAMNSTHTKEFFVALNFYSTFLEALMICNHYGYKFATLETEREYDILQPLLDGFEFNGETSILIGGKRESATSNWYWIENGEPITYEMKNKWHPNEPRDKTCLSFWKKNNKFQFDDTSCDVPKLFICEKYIKP